MKDNTTAHTQEIVPLKRIEGKIRGIQKMIEEKSYCIDILAEISAVIGEIKSVEENILDRHQKIWVQGFLLKDNRAKKEAETDDVIKVLRNFKKY